jgi:hypothetical protein
MARFQTVVIEQLQHRVTVRTTLDDGPDEVTVEHTCDFSDGGAEANRCAQQGALGALRLARLRAETEQRARDHAELEARESMLVLKHGVEPPGGPRPGRLKGPRELDRDRLELARKSPHAAQLKLPVGKER